MAETTGFPGGARDFLDARLVPMLARRLGGPWGSHASGLATAWAYVLATLTWIVCILRQVPCLNGSDQYGWMCYSDIRVLYSSRGQATGGIPYINVNWEYPVLTGYFATVANWISRLFGAVLSPAASPDQLVTNTKIYFAVNAVGLFVCLIWLVSSMLRLAPRSPVPAMLVAVSPAVWSSGLINWDLLAVALTAAGLVSWNEKRPVLAGVWLGLAVAAKLYPIVIVAALVVLCLRRDPPGSGTTFRTWVTMADTAAGTWLLVNLPMMITNFGRWKYFYVLNFNRGADFGSLWYALGLANLGVDDPVWWSRAVIVLGYVGLAVVIYIAPYPPTAPQIAYLAVAVMAVGNLVYSPQYVLWLLPLVVLARPKALEFWVFTAAELNYFVNIWFYLRAGLGHPYDVRWYILSIFIRIGVTIWLMSRVVRDVLWPEGWGRNRPGRRTPVALEPVAEG